MENNNNQTDSCCNHNYDNNSQQYRHSHSHGSEHKHKHNHSHHHHHNTGTGKKLFFVILLNFIITLAEIIGGILSNSLSLISDAMHNLGDAMGLLLAYIATKIGNKKADTKYTFGRKRAEILAAFANSMILILICLYLFKEAYERYQNPEPIKGALMLIVAIIGLLANWISMLLLQKEKDSNINMKAAYLHLLGDTLSSVAVIIGGIAIWIWNIMWLDPLITVLVGLYIVYHTWNVLRQSIDILMQRVPEDIDFEMLIENIKTIPEVANVHHVHLWQLNEERTHFEAHINVKENIDMEQLMKVRKKIEEKLLNNSINHTTLQIGYNCCDPNSPIIENEN